MLIYISRNMKYDKKDVPQFQEDVCKKTCINKGACIEDGKDDRWFLMCPHFFNWKIEYKSFVSEQLEWEREHPEEAEVKHAALVARAKAWGDEQRRLKKDAKTKEKSQNNNIK